MPVRIDAGVPVVLPAIQLEAACELTVQLTSASPGLGAGARVVARNVVGDKFVASVADKDGTAALRPLPPGASQLVVYGEAIAPVRIDRDLTAGKQWLDVQVAPANPVRLSFPFALADNPFLINGPLHVRIYDSDERVVLEDYLGAATSLGRFTSRSGSLRAATAWSPAPSGTPSARPTSTSPTENAPSSRSASIAELSAGVTA